MEWTEIDINGTTIWATDLCDGVMVTFFDPADYPQPSYPVYIPGWRIEWPPELDGPALRRRDQKKMTFSIKAVEE